MAAIRRSSAIKPIPIHSRFRLGAILLVVVIIVIFGVGHLLGRSHLVDEKSSVGRTGPPKGNRVVAVVVDLHARSRFQLMFLYKSAK